MMYGWDKWKAQVNRPLDRLGGDVVIYRLNHETRKAQILHTNENGVTIADDIEEFAVVAPTFRVGDEVELREIIAAFVELGKELGARAPDESHNAGKLEATEKHLEDMRKLVFETKSL